MTVEEIVKSGFRFLDIEADTGEPTDSSLDAAFAYIEEQGVSWNTLDLNDEGCNDLITFFKNHVAPDLWYYTDQNGWVDFIWFLKGEKNVS